MMLQIRTLQNLDSKMRLLMLSSALASIVCQHASRPLWTLPPAQHL